MTDLDARAQALVDGLWRRIRDVLKVEDRVGSFAFGEEPEEDQPAAAALTDDEIDSAARDFVLRAFAVASDDLNARILTAACAEDGVALDELAKQMGTGRLVTAERVSDLLQLGLIARALDTGRARATPAGEAIVELNQHVTGLLAERMRQGRDNAQRGSGRDGLPVL